MPSISKTKAFATRNYQVAQSVPRALLLQLDPALHFIKRENTFLLYNYLFLIGLTLFPATGFVLQSPTTIFAVPALILWISVCITLLCLLSAIGFHAVFRPWSQAIDQRAALSTKSNEERR